MILLKRQKSQLLLFVTLVAVGFGHAQDAGKPSLPSVQDEFEAENKIRARGRQLLLEAFRREYGRVPDYLGDETSGSTGLKLSSAVSTEEVAPMLFESLVYSVLFSTDKGRTPTTSAVTSFDPRGTRYLFANGTADDYGYIFDPTWMGSKTNRWLIMKAGRTEGSAGGYQIYGYQKSNGRIHRIASTHYYDYPLAISPDHRYLASVKDNGLELKQLWVWDSQTERNMVVSTNASLQPSIHWKSATELLYLQVGSEGYDTYIWNVATNKSKLLMANCRNYVPSPDGTLVLGWMEPNSTQSESVYVLKNLKNGTTVTIERAALGKPDVFRQLLWSPDSRYIFSVLNQSTRTGMRVFAYDVVTRKSFLWPIIEPEVKAKILSSSSQGKRIFLLLEQWISTGDGKPFHIAENRHTIVEVETTTGKQKVLWARDGLWGLNENGIALSKTLLQD